MSELIRRSEKAKAALVDESSPRWQRASLALQAFAGLELAGIATDDWAELEAILAEANQVLSRYAIESEADYQRVNDDDLQVVLDLVDQATSLGIAAELDRIVTGLDVAPGKLPVDAINEARQHRDLMIPRLIKALRDAASGARAGEMPEGNAHFFAIFLLSEFRAEESFSAILEVFSLPGELPFDLVGDVVTSVLARLLAQFAGDRPDLIDEIILNQDLNEYVRWEAAQAYVNMVRDGRMGRDDAVARLRACLRHEMDREEPEIIGGILCVLANFAPVEALDDIREAYKLGLVDEYLIDLEFIEESVSQGAERVEEELRRCSPTGIDDTIEELRHWASFRDRPPAVPKLKPIAPTPVPRSPLSAASESYLPAARTPITRGDRVGRNDPCPCGSGKKFKKCCGARK